MLTVLTSFVNQAKVRDLYTHEIKQMREQGKSKEFTILNPRSDERNDPFFWEILVITLLSTCHGLTKTKTNFLTEDRVQFLWEMDKLNMLADCLNFAFWSAFEEKWWLFHYGNDIEDFLSMCNYKNSRACNYISIYTENSSNLFFFLFLSWSNILFWCLLLLLNRTKI